MNTSIKRLSEKYYLLFIIYYTLFAICCAPFFSLTAQDFQSLRSQYEIGQPDKRKEALEKIARIQTHEALHLLIVALKDPDPSVRETAFRNLITSWPRDEILPAIFPLLDDPEMSIRNSVKKFILSKTDIKTFEHLKNFLTTARKEINLTIETISTISDFPQDMVIHYFKAISNENDNIRYALAKILYKFHHNNIAINILEKYLKDEIPEIRLEAAKSISAIGYYPLIEKMLFLLSDRDERIKKNIRTILENMATRDSLIYWIEALKSDDPRIRNFCVEMICKISEPQSLPIVFSMLEDPNETVRNAAISGIHNLYSNSLNHYLISELKSSTPLKRKISAQLLKLSKSDEFVPLLFHALEKEKNKDVATELSNTITEICSLKNIPVLRWYLYHPATAIRITAIKCLAKISATSYEEVVEILSEFTKKEKNISVQKELLISLRDIKPAPSQIVFHWTVNQPVEIKLLTIEFISTTSDIAALPSLITAANDKNADVSYKAKDAIEKIIKTTKHAEVLSEYLKSPREHIQLFILNILKRFPTQIVIENLKMINFENAKTEIKYATIEVIRNAKLATPHPFLILALRDKNAEVRWAALKAINETQVISITHEILAALSDPIPSVREEALKAIAKNPRFEYTPKIMPLLSDADTAVRYNALVAIEHITNEESLRKISSMLSDSDPAIRSLAAKIVGKSNFSSAIEKLRKMAETDIYPECRKEAARALYMLGDSSEKAIEIYFSLIKDSNASVRDEARNILDRLLTRSHLQHILKALFDDNKNSRSYALSIIAKLKLYEANPHLFNMVKISRKESKKERQELLAVLSLLLDEGDVIELEELYNLNNHELKLWVIEQSGKLKSEGAINLLVRALREPNPAFRQKAIEVLPSFKDARIQTALNYISENDPDPVLRKLAKEKLKK